MVYTQNLKELTQYKIKMLHLEFWDFFAQMGNSDHCEVWLRSILYLCYIHTNT
jgi:hypothetical protein